MAEYTEIYLKRDSKLNWEAANPRLGLGEPGIDMTLHRFKVGNGIDKWNQLPYMDADLYSQLDTQAQAAADKAQELLNLINANKLDADTKHNAVTTELRQTSRSLNERMTAVEVEQREYEDDLTEKFEVTKLRVDQGLDEFNETRDNLTTRMDVIAGQTTEDTEILDARVDANYNTYPNLGANIRHIHSELTEAQKAESKDRTENDDALQVQTDTLSGAVFRQALSIRQEAEQRRKVAEALADETTQRAETDSQIQSQVDTLQQETSRNAAEIQNVSEALSEAISEEQCERARADEILREAVDAEKAERIEADSTLRDGLHSESVDRLSADKALQAQTDNLAEVSLRHSLNLQEDTEKIHGLSEALAREVSSRVEGESQNAQEIQRAHERIDSEEAARIEADGAIRDEVQEALDAEVTIRSEADREINARLDAEQASRIYYDAVLRQDLDSETYSRVEADTQLNEDFHGSLAAEAQDRVENDNALQTQADNLSHASIQQSLRLLEEVATRKEQDNELRQALNDEVSSRIEADEQLSEDFYHALTAETCGRADNDNVLQAQIDKNARAIIESALTFREAKEQIKNDLVREQAARISADEELRQRSEEIAQAQSEALHSEAQDRTEQGEALQTQLNTLSSASIRQDLTVIEEAEKRRQLAQAIAGIKSPIDWSKAESIAIPEPRCAIVNFTGINAMPTSKTVELSAFMEFWDMQGNYFKKPILCAAQGSSSMGYVKKNVKFDLLNEDGSEFNLKIGKWVEQDGFHLKAYYTDFFRGVGVTSYKFWEEVMQTKPHKKALVDVQHMNATATGTGNVSDLSLQIDSGALCHPDGFPCIVYLNGTFYGVFSWQIKKQRKNYQMDKSTVEHIHLDGSLSTSYFWDGVINWTVFEIRNPNKLYTMDGKKYDGDAPRELIDETSEKYNPDNKDHVRSAKVKKYIQDFVRRFGELKAAYNTYRTSDPDRVRGAYEELFDVENQRDYFVFSDVIKNSDGLGKNWQWTTYDGVKWYVNAYDLDMSYGGMFNGTQITAPLTGHITTSTAIPTGYMALLYQSEIEARYKDLRDAGIIDVEHIVSKLEDWTARIGQSNYILEYERWPQSPCLLNYNDSVDRVRKWLTAEIANMDRVYHYTPSTIEAVAQAMTDSLNAEISSRRSADIDEAHERSIDDVALRRQIDKLALLALQNEFRARDFNKQHKDLAEQDSLIRSEQRENLNLIRAEFDRLTCTVLRFALNDYEARERLREYLHEIYQAVADTGNLTYMGAGVASTNEVGSMLADVMSGTDDGEMTTSEIPEALQGRVSTSSEVGDMLAEVFNNN